MMHVTDMEKNIGDKCPCRGQILQDNSLNQTKYNKLKAFYIHFKTPQ